MKRICRILFILLFINSGVLQAQERNELFAWGSNRYGQMGDGSQSGRMTTPVQVESPTA